MALRGVVAREARGQIGDEKAVIFLIWNVFTGVGGIPRFSLVVVRQGDGDDGGKYIAFYSSAYTWR